MYKIAKKENHVSHAGRDRKEDNCKNLVADWNKEWVSDDLVEIETFFLNIISL